MSRLTKPQSVSFTVLKERQWVEVAVTSSEALQEQRERATQSAARRLIKWTPSWPTLLEKKNKKEPSLGSLPVPIG